MLVTQGRLTSAARAWTRQHRMGLLDGARLRGPAKAAPSPAPAPALPTASAPPSSTRRAAFAPTEPMDEETRQAFARAAQRGRASAARPDFAPTEPLDARSPEARSLSNK